MNLLLPSLRRRDGTAPPPAMRINPAAGVTPPEDMHTKIIFIVFGVIGAGFVLTGIWFFFWARNGGFYFKHDDWDEYKSTVLRRRGPNGTTLSGATTVTDLGGGSVVHGMGDEAEEKRRKKKMLKQMAKKSEKLDQVKSSGRRSLWGGKARDDDDDDPVVFKKKKATGRSLWGGSRATRSLWNGWKGGKGKDAEAYKDYDEESELTSAEMAERAGGAQRLRGGGATSGYHDDDGLTVADTDMHSSVQEAIRSYRHEKPARVGGLNKESEASTWDGSTGLDGSMVSGTSSNAALLQHQQATPTNSPKKKKAQRAAKDKGSPQAGNGKGKARAANAPIGGIRKVISTSGGPKDTDRTTSGGFWSRKNRETPPRATTTADTERIRSEARKLQEKGRAAGAATGNHHGRRDFSFTSGIPDDSTVVTGATTESAEELRRQERRRERAERRERLERERDLAGGGTGAATAGRDGRAFRVPGSWDGSGLGSDVGSSLDGSAVGGGDARGEGDDSHGTKAYRHVIPGLSGGRTGAADGFTEERRRARGFRREA